MAIQWNSDQKKAIDARGFQTLVSAAAGSGKTAVLTERVKNILCDTETRCSVSEILVVTFTRAAAAEMRDRIGEALKKELKVSKDSAYIKKQITLLPTADICTIDSFCGRLVKENFSQADISADYGMLDETEETVLLRKCADAVLEDLYDRDEEDFRRLNRMFLTERDDKAFVEILLSLYRYSRSFPNPSRWLDSVVNSFDPTLPASLSVWAEIMKSHICDICEYHIGVLQKCVELMVKDGEFKPDYINAFSLTIQNLEKILAASLGPWNGFVEQLRETPVVSCRCIQKNADESIKEFCKNCLKNCGEDFKKLWDRMLPTEEEHIEDMTLLFPVVKKLCDAVKDLTELSLAEKKEQNRYSFDDILHKSISVLGTFTESGFERSELAISLSEKYKEILIDEYQDTNEAQNLLFESVSQNKANLYCVGDVKQSIYRFRLASPELFTALRKSLTDYDGSCKPSLITLKQNFRSRKGITEAVNYVFSELMSEKVGQVEYTENEYLNYGATYGEKDNCDVELHFSNVYDLKTADSLAYEADLIAKSIQETVNSGVTVTDKKSKEVRKVGYGDFCILLRSVKGKVSIYSEALQKRNIPVSFESDTSAVDSAEVMVFLSLLKCISNPLLDVPLTAVMMSPLFGFTPDEMAQIRLADDESDLYACLVQYAESNRKAQEFLRKIKVYRNASVTKPINEFVEFLFEDTDIQNIYLALRDGEDRRGSLRGVLKSAEKFCEDGRCGLSSFIRYLDDLCETGNLKRYSVAEDSMNCVKIMSIHKSKGLEFPYVYLASTCSGFNKRDSYGAMTVSRETGLGLKIRDEEKYTQYHTLSSAACEQAIVDGSISEEMRILYVALTRAKENLVIFCTNNSKTLNQRVFSYLKTYKKGVPASPYGVKKALSMGEWLLMAFSTHPDCEEYRKLLGCYAEFGPASFPIKLVIHDETESAIAEETTEEEALPDGELVSKLKQQIEYEYPFDSLNGILAKRTASSLENHGDRKRFFEQVKPAFLCDTLKGADKGTAIHKFLELCDFRNAALDFESEKQRLVYQKAITEEETAVMDKSALQPFFGSDIGQFILSAEHLYKEYEFSVLVSAGEIYDNLSAEDAEEEIVLEGKIDCAAIKGERCVIIDYKTDNITDESLLCNIYKNQLFVYRKAFEECERVKVTDLFIYSFKMKKFIEVKM